MIVDKCSTSAHHEGKLLGIALHKGRRKRNVACLHEFKASSSTDGDKSREKPTNTYESFKMLTVVRDLYKLKKDSTHRKRTD